MFLTTLSSPHTPRKAELYANLYSIELIPILFLFFFFSFFEFIFLSAVGVLGICHITGIWMPRKKMITDLLLFFISLKKKTAKYFNSFVHGFKKKKTKRNIFFFFFLFFLF